MSNLVLLFLALLGWQSFASTQSFNCRNDHFLQAPFSLKELSEGIWLLENSEKSCELMEESNILYPSSDSCSLRNLSRPDKEREVLFLEKPSLEKSFLKISLDNSFAQYGTRSLKSFLKCQPSP